MKPGTLRLSLVIAAALVFGAPRAPAQDGLRGVLSPVDLGSARLVTHFQQTLATADFDGDDKPDGAVLVDSGWLRPHASLRAIELHFTARANFLVTFETTESALAISALDVNLDGAPDIVVEQPFTHKRLQVWLNDGHGDLRAVPSEQFAFAGSPDRQRTGSSQRTGSPAVCLPPQRGLEFAALRTRRSSHYPGFANVHGLRAGSPLIISRAIAPSSPRAPPLAL